MKNLLLTLALLMPACMLDTTPDSNLEVENLSEELILTPIITRPGFPNCVTEAGGWCNTQAAAYEGAWSQNATNYTDVRLEFMDMGNLPGSPQICNIVRRVNDCNYVRACWLTASDQSTGSGALVVSTKVNPGQSTFTQCGQNGITAVGLWSAPRLTYSNTFTHSIRVLWTGSSSLPVSLDGAPYKVATLPASVQSFVGHASVGTENMVTRFRSDAQ